jgi:pimeloyl-ACP methyl ester carboxylesterase
MGGVSRRGEELLTAASTAVLAEITGKGLDLSEEPLDLSAEQLTGIDQPTLIVSAEDSPDLLRRINDRLATVLPNVEHVIVTGGHLINPAHPAVLDFVNRILTVPAGPTGQ